MARKRVDEALPTNWREEATLTIQQYRRLMRIGHNAAYASVHAGEVPTIKVGGSIRVSVPGLLRKLEGAAEADAA
jgi:hypothetical protein